LLAVLVAKLDPNKEALAGKSTVNRLELTQASAKGRYKPAAWKSGRAFLPRPLLLSAIYIFWGSFCCVRGCGHRTLMQIRSG
jgi:hypothetical protein